jgi:hypothetical protein
VQAICILMVKKYSTKYQIEPGLGLGLNFLCGAAPHTPVPRPGRDSSTKRVPIALSLLRPATATATATEWLRASPPAPAPGPGPWPLALALLALALARWGFRTAHRAAPPHRALCQGL